MNHDVIYSQSRISWVKPCIRCNTEVTRYIGETHINCPECGALYNAFGNLLRDDALGNPSIYNDDISDLEGYELQHANDYDY